MATLYSVQTGSVALSASATKSLWLINPATDGIKLVEIGVSFDASTAATAVRLDLYRTTTVGSPAGTTSTQVKYIDANTAASSVAGLTALSAEPTAVEILESYFINQFGGVLVKQFPLGREPGTAAAGARLGLRAVTPASVTPNVVSYVVFEEQ